MTIAALIVAAGRGTRAGGSLPKQWRSLGDDPACPRVIDHTIHALRPFVDTILVVHHTDDLKHTANLHDVTCVEGGDSRSASVKAGLAALSDRDIQQVLIHDAARALVPAQVIQDVIAALAHSNGAAPALPVTDALWRGTDTVDGTQDRTDLWRAQTPQGFDFKSILRAHTDFTGSAADDVEVARAAQITVAITTGHEDNFKITHADDFFRAERILAQRTQLQKDTSPMDIRLGNGYDVHRFGAGDHVWICGVKVPHTRTLQGHSDADVGMHALTDAIYGALAMGDIGQHFPPSDMKWKGAASDIFLRHAIDLARSKGYDLGNCDVTLVCEHPKIGPHADAMRQTLADIMSVDIARVSVKATTSERLGFTGREEGIASLATATLIKP
ncbi:bifunctional 2-C-methyl-D-erythritol 4-phosphate cytidylyltransferase/2-C-methyl-D-erythritol 2,4-cyclodiphosphate synthase [Pacificibacter marinus]|uniref:Bifunctional enzyme IspD/IspF n=1 Tax=Pacificibacter marinus TaxID=658057 RepID=A0A1Y5STH0_9RHOB|nr:bifunctional 2-C-methyl-D-erythritol 4-phosphate cytidylyltransferase/2-C-methyl-D-erythritol 2,4-cyclodiphosphate synthase [Pacificibacter marinus]SEK82887.1 2-C-methyl-D-erythritol 2,4-cyclodiphosphate synthase [Pacificibacter marinus]SLN48129.1 Bifunctional enzyme IspD/IspF [Pacificibacter marinus]